MSHYATKDGDETAFDRDLRLDACRGISLWFIFLDHIPNNIFSWLTLRHYGFSDTTEVFMFVSGVTCTLAYSAVLYQDGWSAVVSHTLRRTWEIYAAFLILIGALVVLVWLDGRGRLADEVNVRIVLEQPGAALAHAAVLLYRPVNTDVLPTFVLFHLLFAPLLWSVLRFPNVCLFASALLYLLVQLYGWNLPEWPVNGWYFNPLAWQVLVVLGAWWVVVGHSRLASILTSGPVVASAATYLLFSLVVALSWDVKLLEIAVPSGLAAVLYPIDKPNLDPLRLLHFIAVVIVVTRFIPAKWPGFATLGWKMAIRCGESSLETYCAGVVLSLVAYMLLSRLSDGWLAQFAVSAGGIIALVAFATSLAWVSRRSRRRPRLM